MTYSTVDLARGTLLAQGAYALFSSERLNKEALIESDKGDLSPIQAVRFLGERPDPNGPTSQGFEVRHHQPNDSTGFSATAFFDRSSNKYILGIRGTDQYVIDILEDAHRIGLQGFAGDQLVSLYRYYRRLTTPVGQPVRYSDAEVSQLQLIRLGVFVNPASLAIGALKASTLRSQLALDVGETPWTGSGPSVLSPGAPLIVTGHSLGGHLALLFGRMFPSVTEHVYTYNAPGISPLIGAAGLQWLGVPSISPARVTNVSAVMGSELISLIPAKPGQNIGVNTEPGGPVYQHSIVPLTDALALYGAFATLSPGLSTDAESISRIISASSMRPEESLERTLDFLRKALGIDSTPTQVARILADLDQRDDYYANLYGLLDSRTAGLDYGIVPLAGKTPREIMALASSEVSVRHALRELMPFAVKEADHSAFSDTQSVGWLSARAEMLATLNGTNQIDLPFAANDLSQNVLFDDRISGRRLAILRPADAIVARQFLGAGNEERMERFLRELAYDKATVFAADLTGAGEAISGLNGDDRLFGGTGDDRLDGGRGNDLLEGGAGADVLNGGEGGDTLAGGEGADRLEGGAGDDTYVFGTVLDADTIVDRDGEIYAGATRLTGGSGGEEGRYLSGDGLLTYAFSGDLASQGTLVINSALRVEGFRNGDLGIRLVDGVERGIWTPATETDLLGDYEYVPFWASPTQFVGSDEFGNPLPETRAAAAPGRQDLDEEFPGTPGNTHFVMGGGDDFAQDILGGDDRIELGSGDDAGFGGAGNDLVEGGPGRDLIAGGRGNDVLHAGSLGTIEADLDDEATATYGNGGDLLSGGEGDDTIVGDAEANIIEGGPGQDHIFGGAGDDWIGSDIAELARREVYQAHPPNNDSINRIVDYLWTIYSGPPTFSLQAGGGFASPGIARIGSTRLDVFYLERITGDADEIDAGPGDDTIAAGGGDDLIFAGSGDDYIDPGEGADTVFGGDGDDYIPAYWDAIGDYIDAGVGNDFVYSGAGDDILIGGSGADRLHSFGGNDVLLGGEGRDFLSGSGGSAVFDGGPGDDMLYARASADGVSRVRVGRGSGLDVLEAWGGPLVVDIAGGVSPAEVSVARTQHAIPARDGPAGGLETLTGIMVSLGADGDALFMADLQPTDLQAARSIEFADGTVWNEETIESLASSPGSAGEPAALAGTGAADLLYGGAGADSLSGAGGDDWLAGDAGDDVYLYAAGDGFDRIEDNSGSADVLRFAAGVGTGNVDVYSAGADYILAAGDGGVRISGGRTQEGAIERVEFPDGTAWSAAGLEGRAEVLPDNRAPQMPALLGSVAVEPGSPVEIAIDRDAISDPDRFDSLSFYAVTAHGERLPEWLQFDASALAFSGTPAASDAGVHEVLLIAADSAGAASIGNLTISVGGGEAAPVLEVPAVATPIPTPTVPAVLPGATDAPPSQYVSAPVRRDDALAGSAAAPLPVGDPPRVGVPADPLFRDMQQRFDVLLQTGRTDLGERYADAVREFEERRVQREESPPPALPTEEEVEAWNSAMHSWHDRNPGFAETDLGGNDGTWTMGWGLPGPGESALGGSAVAGALPGVAHPLSRSRLTGATAAPMLSEGMREIR